MKTRHHLTCGRSAEQRGFSLVELSVVLVVIAAIMGAVMSGMNVYRQAALQRMFSEFVMGWRSTYQSYVAVSHNIQPGDDPGNPRYAINGAAGSAMCGTQLMNAMLANGIALPDGRGPELHDRYVYTDQSGAPHELRVCLVTVPWSIPGASVGTYRTAPRHVLRMEGLTPSAAISLDALVDGRVDARFGDLREDAQAASTSAATAQWSRDANARFNNLSEGQEVELVGFLLLGR
ncbi:prepilin-type N-terminal cleavage/methylation domain-containing protein [Pseudacidovorax intermedius]|uniref:prepilin-type N-terminal cleavage/methylation domain-containing protein n=1 Tax=Pseudacidovorax intermedius TaxID=433924 RepID=UPI0005B78082|nr:prepilin-type N-terminal cleavage/methylation domain-containing protein [Pseudacidovorax intermedius]